MRAEYTRRGGRHVAEERDAFEPAEYEPDPPIRPATAPLVQFLADGSLAALNEMYERLPKCGSL